MFSLLFNFLQQQQQQQQNSTGSNFSNNKNITTNSTCPEFVSSIPSFQKNEWANCSDTIIMPILSGVCLVLYAILVAFCVLGVVKKRNSGHLQSRTLSGIVVTLSGSFIYVSVTLLRFSIGRSRFPCLLFSIVSYTIPPCFAMPSILRCLRLVLQHRLNLIKTTLSRSYCLSRQHTDNLFVQVKTSSNSTRINTATTTSVVTSGTIVEAFENNQVGNHLKMGTREKFIMKAHSILTDHTSSLLIFWLAIGLQMFLWFVLLTVEASFFKDQHYFMDGALLMSLEKGCGLGFPSTIVVVATSVVYFVIEFICIGFCFTCDNDTWNIKKEVFLLVISQILAAALFSFFSLASIVEVVDYFAPSGFVVVVYSTFEVVLTILIPILKAIYKDSKERWECNSELEMIISNKETFQILLDYLRKSFCPENLLCYADIEKYKRETSSRRRKNIAHTMVKKYLDADSPLLLNLPSELYSVKVKIMDIISFADDQNSLPEDLFSEIQVHVLGNLIDAYSRLKFSNNTIQKVSKDWNANQQKRLSSRLTNVPSMSSLKV